MYFEAIIRKEGKGYRVSFPGLVNVLTYAETLQGALQSAQEALIGCLLEDLNRGLDVPVPSVPARRSGRYLVPVPLRITAALHLRMLRKKEGWTTQQVAERLRISRQAYEKLERGKGNPSVDTLETAMAVFGRRPEIALFPVGAFKGTKRAA